MTGRCILIALAVFLAGTAIGTLLHLPALQHDAIYKDDVVQSPHWAAYHQSTFRDDDLILKYASFNESPLQNAIYWIGTYFVEFIPLTKYLAVISYGVLSAIFFLVGSSTHGVRFGLLLTLFVWVIPESWEFSPGFFAKFWMTPLLLLCVFCLQSRRWHWLIGLLPFGAIAYPKSALLLGSTAAVYALLARIDRSGDRMRFLRSLGIGSALAVAILLVKYASIPEFVGSLRPGDELRQMAELRSGSYPSWYIPIPSVAEAILLRLNHPFVLIGTLIYCLALGRRIAWERSWSALLIASVVLYLLADLLFMRLYVPNRYTRHTVVILLALWNASNVELILQRIERRSLRLAAIGGLLILCGWSFAATFVPDAGSSDRRELAALNRFIREELPPGILIAGSPRALDGVMIQARRSVLTPYKLAHPWYTTYYDEIRERTYHSLVAHFTLDPKPLEELHERYGVTHFLADRRLFDALEAGKRVFGKPYDARLIASIAERTRFLIRDDLPPERILFEDENYILFELPLTASRER